MTPPRTLEEIAERLAGDAYRLATLDGAWATEKILAALREAADAAIEHEKAYTCGCGLYVHHVRFNPKAVHSSDCPFGQAADAPRQEAREEEREALRSEFGDFMDETIDWLLRMNRTADPGTDEPKNFEPDLRTRAAIAAWLMDSRKPILLAWLDARSRAEEPKP